jgi:hypothetical protein
LGKQQRCRLILGGTERSDGWGSFLKTKEGPSLLLRGLPPHKGEGKNGALLLIPLTSHKGEVKSGALP